MSTNAPLQYGDYFPSSERDRLQRELAEANAKVANQREQLIAAKETFERIRAIVLVTDQHPMPCEHYVQLRMNELIVSNANLSTAQAALQACEAREAQMREALRMVDNVLSVCRIGWEQIYDKVRNALASTGSDYVERLRVTEEERDKLRYQHTTLLREIGAAKHGDSGYATIAAERDYALARCKALEEAGHRLSTAS